MYLEKFFKRRLATIKQRCNNKNHSRYQEYGGRGIKCHLTTDMLSSLWYRDKAYLMSYPTVDRIKKTLSYTFDNCQWLEMKENDAKDKRISIVQLNLQGLFLKKWNSFREASRILKIPHSNISNVLNKHRTSAGKYKWNYYHES